MVRRRVLHLGAGRIVASDIEAPIVLEIWYEVDERQYKATMRPSPIFTTEASGSTGLFVCVLFNHVTYSTRNGGPKVAMTFPPGRGPRCHY
jgi:hypothetical protein